MAKSNFVFAFSVSLVLVIFQGFGETAISQFRYENTVLQTGEWWRLLTGHFVHLGWMHLILNLAGFWILSFIFSRPEKPLTGLITIIVLAVCISLALLIFSPAITWYVGFSGVLHGLIVIGAVASFRYDRRMAIALLVGVSVKLFWEQFFANPHAMEFTLGGKVVYDAHLYGAITGVLIIIGVWAKTKIDVKVSHSH